MSNKTYPTRISRLLKSQSKLLIPLSLVCLFSSQAALADTVVMQKRSTNFSMDGGPGAENRRQVKLWNRNDGNKNQQWDEISVGGGFYQYKKKNTNHCLDGGSGAKSGQRVILYRCNSSNKNQHWEKKPVSRGNTRLKKRGFSFSIDGGKGAKRRQGLTLRKSSDSNVNQHWFIRTVGGSSTPSPRPSNPGFDFRIWDIEGDSPVKRDGSLEFNALRQCVITPNGNGCRHEQKVKSSERHGFTKQFERFAANVEVSLSRGSETIVAQHHPEGTGTLSALYLSDTKNPANGVSNGRARDGVFDIYATVRKPGGGRGNETVVFGTIRSGQSFSYEVINDHGRLTMKALGKTFTVTSADSSESYFKFGNYQQARDPVSRDRIDLPKPHRSDARRKFLDYYNDKGMTESKIVFRNVEYSRRID